MILLIEGFVRGHTHTSTTSRFRTLRILNKRVRVSGSTDTKNKDVGMSYGGPYNLLRPLTPIQNTTIIETW